MLRITLILTIFYECSQAQHDSPWRQNRDHDYYYDPLHPEDDLPSITTPITHTNHLVRQNENVILPCAVEKLGAFSLTWQHEDNILWILQEREEGPYVMHVENDSDISRAGSSLSLSNVTLEDSGNYTCQVNTQPPRSLTHTLQVRVPPTIRAANNRTVVTVKKGHPITLSCHAHGIPKPRVTWTKKEGELIGAETFGPNLTLPTAGSKDNGVYVCTAEDDSGNTASADIMLQVLYPPKVRAESEVVYTGMNYETSLACVVEGEPVPQVKWFKGGVEPVNPLRLFKSVDASKRFSLQFARVQRGDFGNYTCNATNFMGNDSALISLQGRPKPVRYYSVGVGENGTSYTLVWHVESYAPVITYNIAYKNESDLEELWVNFTVPGTTSSSHYHSSSHTFTQLQPGATYHVQVTATNEFGESDVNQTFSFTTTLDDVESGIVPNIQENHKNNINANDNIDDGASWNSTGNYLTREGDSALTSSQTKVTHDEDEVHLGVDDTSSGLSLFTPTNQRTHVIAFVTASIIIFVF